MATPLFTPLNFSPMKHTYKPLGILLFILCANGAFAQIQITLRRSFIDSLKNKVTISADYVVDKAHAHPNPPAKDGDMHIAGRAESIGLPIVAEIMNAKGQTSAVQFVHSVEGTDRTTGITGVWRIWCEHAGEDLQVQGEPLTAFQTTNPPHVFEIHPITRFGTFNLLPTLKPIVGFDYKTAEDALFRYAAARSQILVNSDNTVTIQTNGIGFNYVECKIELLNEPVEEDDGRFVFCKILSLENEIIAQKVRVAFVKGSRPETVEESLAVGKMMHIVAIPRIDLALVAFRADHANDTRFPNILNWNLPFELVAVAVVE